MDINEIERLEMLVRLTDDYHYELQNTLREAVLSILEDMKNYDQDRCPNCGN